MRTCMAALCLAMSLPAGAAAELKLEPAIEQAPSSIELLAGTAALYRGLASYQDQGELQELMESEAGSGPQQQRSTLTFSTAFSRAGDFRFQYRHEPGAPLEANEMVIWRHGDQLRSWWSIKGVVEQPDSLAAAVAVATGVSRGTAYTVPSALLVPLVAAEVVWLQPQGSRRIADASTEGQDCYRVQRLRERAAAQVGGQALPGSRSLTTYWLSKQDLHLLRLDEDVIIEASAKAPALQVQRRVRYQAQLNTELPAGALAFGH